MSRHARLDSASLLALVGAATLLLAACEPTQAVDASQVRPAGSAPSEEPGHTVKFDSNQGANAPAGGGAAAPK